MNPELDYDSIAVRAVNAEIDGLSKALTTEYQKLTANPYVLAAESGAEGALAIALSVVALPEIGILTGLMATMSMAAGFAEIGVSIAQLVSIISDDAKSVERTSASFDIAMDWTRNPYSLLLGTSELAMDSEEGRRGVELGKFVSGLAGIAGGVMSLGRGRNFDASASLVSGMLDFQAVDGTIFSNTLQSRQSTDRTQHQDERDDAKAEGARRADQMAALIRDRSQRESDDQSRRTQQRLRKEQNERIRRD